MPTLLDTQRAMLRAVIFGDPGGAAPDIIGGTISPAERLNVYRNTFLSSLTTALRISFPAIQRLVGEEFFEGAAQSFIQAHPPQTAYLNAYGVEFGDFLAQFPPAASLPYLADVARLEWAVNGALHARDATPIGRDALADLADAPPESLVLVPHPSISLLRLDHPAEAIWRAVLAGDDGTLGAIDPSAGPEWLMIERSANGVEVLPIAESEWRFTAALCTGKTLAKAAEGVADTEMVSVLAGHLAAGRFIGFRLDENRQLARSENAL